MQQLSNFLLTLWRGALEKPEHEYKDWALSEVSTVIPFDSCAWGKGRWINELPVVHSIHLHKLSGDFSKSWSSTQHEYKLTREVTTHPNRTFNVDMAREYANTYTYVTHCKKYHIEHILGTGSNDAETSLLTMMVFHRSDINQPFTEQERSLKEILFQHLLDAARINWLINLPKCFSVSSHFSDNTLAAFDNTGLLHVATPSFLKMFQKEWPSWNGPFLPAGVLETENGKSYVGNSIVIDFLAMNELTILRARARVAADSLSARELEIAQQISDGLDCKTIAQSLDISPSTVKNHTSKIYQKLDINDKAKLAAELSKLAF